MTNININKISNNTADLFPSQSQFDDLNILCVDIKSSYFVGIITVIGTLKRGPAFWAVVSYPHTYRTQHIEIQIYLNVNS